MQALNKPSTFTFASGQNAATDPAHYIRKQEFDVGMSGRAPVAHTHNALSIEDLFDAVLLVIDDALTDSSTIQWDRDAGKYVPNVVLKPSGGLGSDDDGVFLLFGTGAGQVAEGNHTHAQLHDALTLDASDTIDATLGGGGQVLSLEVRVAGDGGLEANPDGSGVQCAFGTGHNQVSRGDHTHAQLHDPVTIDDTNSVDLTLTAGQLLTAAVKRKTSLSTGQGAILEAADGIYVSLGTTANQAAAGDHTHAAATELESGFLSPELYRKLINAADVVQFDQNIAFDRHDVIVGSGTEYIGGRFRFGQSMQCVFLDLTASGGAGSGVLGLEIGGSVVESIDIPADATHGEVASYKSISDVFCAADTYIRMKVQSGFDPVAIENNPSRIHVTVGLRPALVSAPTIKLNSGGTASDPFSADGYYTGGSASSTTTACDTSGVSNPATQAVYKSIRRQTTADTIAYNVTGLARGLIYNVRLHFNQIIHDEIGDEVFHIKVTGETVATTADFDIFAEAGGANVAFIKEYSLKPNSSGEIEILLQPVYSNGQYGCSICGLEVIPET